MATSGVNVTHPSNTFPHLELHTRIHEKGETKGKGKPTFLPLDGGEGPKMHQPKRSLHAELLQAKVNCPPMKFQKRELARRMFLRVLEQRITLAMAFQKIG